MNKGAESSAGRVCAHAARSAAYLNDELDVGERAAFEAHLAECATCRCEVEAMRRTLAILRTLPPLEASRDLAPVILASVRTRRPRGTWWLPPGVRALAAAAGLALLLGGWWWMCVCRTKSVALPPSEPPTAALDQGNRAVKWLCRVQEANGSWDTARWGGDKRFEVALTGLSLLAILQDSAAKTETELRRAVDRAVSYLLSQQTVEGGFGEDFDASPYNDGIATLALVHADRVLRDDALHLAADRAVKAVCARQNPDGGWGYRNETARASNLSITLWQVEALRLAAVSAWPEAGPNTLRSLRWVASVADDDGSFGYRQKRDFPEGARTLTAMGAMSVLDEAAEGLLSPARRRAIHAQIERLAAAPANGIDYYQWYFLSVALKKMGEGAPRQQLSALRDQLIALQVRRGPDAGSWNADDRWSPVGGRVYSTAMASLALR